MDPYHRWQDHVKWDSLSVKAIEGIFNNAMRRRFNNDLLLILENSTVYPDSLMNGGSTKPSQSQLTIRQSGDRYNTLNTPLYCLSLRPQPTQRRRAEASPLIFCTTLLGLAAVAGAGLGLGRDNRINYLWAVQWPATLRPGPAIRPGPELGWHSPLGCRGEYFQWLLMFAFSAKKQTSVGCQ